MNLFWKLKEGRIVISRFIPPGALVRLKYLEVVEEKFHDLIYVPGYVYIDQDNILRSKPEKYKSSTYISR